jgi:PAS domain S-box-containing protein
MAGKYDQSLSRSTLTRMGLRVAVVVVIMTAITYFHVYSVTREQSLGKLEKYIVERAQRDRQIFILAEKNHRSLKNELLFRLQQPASDDYSSRFDNIFTRFPDGVTRNRLDNFDGTRDAFAYVGKGVEITPEKQRLLLTFLDLSNEYGPAWHHTIQNLYFTTLDNILVGYWPEVPDWAYSLPADFYMPDEEYVRVATRESNPARETVWTGLFYDVAGEEWMVSAETPVDFKGDHIATIGHDILLNELLERTINDHLDGAFNVIFRDDGRLIAHPDKLDDIKDKGGEYDINTSSDAQLQHIYQVVMAAAGDDPIIDNTRFGNYLAVSRIDEPGWYFVTVYPEHMINAPAFDTARIILFIGVISLLLELWILSWILRRNVAAPLNALDEAVTDVQQGNMDIHLEEGRKDELGRIARSFNIMAHTIKERNASLVEERNFVEAIFESANAVVIVLDKTGNITRFNSAAEKLSGYTAEEAVGQKVWEFLLRPQDIESVKQVFKDLAIGNLSGIHVNYWLTRQGAERLIEWNNSVICDDDAEFESVVSVGIDVTEKHRVEEELQKYREQLEELVVERTRELHSAQDALVRKERLAALGQLTATVSHELRNPLGSMQSSLYLLKKHCQQDDELVARTIERIQRGIDRCDKIIDELLDFTRVSELSVIELELDQWVDQFLDELDLSAEIALHRKLKLGRRLIRFDADRLRRALINVVQNAAQSFSEAAANDQAIPDPYIAVRSHINASGDRVEIQVVDNGPGIAADVLPRIFEPLYSTKSFGVGLGMAVVRQIMQQHGGDVEVTSSPGEGTCVTLWWPQATV